MMIRIATFDTRMLGIDPINDECTHTLVQENRRLGFNIFNLPNEDANNRIQE